MLEALSSTQNPETMLILVVPLILKEEPPILQALIRLATNIIKKTDSETLRPIILKIIDPLVATFNHPHADVRKRYC